MFFDVNSQVFWDVRDMKWLKRHLKVITIFLFVLYSRSAITLDQKVDHYWQGKRCRDCHHQTADCVETKLLEWRQLGNVAYRSKRFTLGIEGAPDPAKENQFRNHTIDKQDLPNHDLPNDSLEDRKKAAEQ
jgi:hypothetical protein